MTWSGIRVVLRPGAPESLADEVVSRTVAFDGHVQLRWPSKRTRVLLDRLRERPASRPEPRVVGPPPTVIEGAVPTDAVPAWRDAVGSLQGVASAVEAWRFAPSVAPPPGPPLSPPDPFEKSSDDPEASTIRQAPTQQGPEQDTDGGSGVRVERFALTSGEASDDCCGGERETGIGFDLTEDVTSLPGGRGEHVTVGVVEQGLPLLDDGHWDHPDLPKDPPVVTGGHEGDASRKTHALQDVGVLAGQGTHHEGMVPAARLVIGSALTDLTSGPVGDYRDAMLAVAVELSPGDVLLVEGTVPFVVAGRNAVGPMSCEPSHRWLVDLLADYHRVVIEPMGNDDLDFDSVALPWDLDGHTTLGAAGGGSGILVTATKCGRALRFGRGTFVPACGWGEYVTTLTPDGASACGHDGTSAASAQIAGVAALVQSVIKAHFGGYAPPELLRTLLTDPVHAEPSPAGDDYGAIPQVARALRSLGLPV